MSNGEHATEERKTIAENLRADGWGYKRIANYFGVSKSAVQKWFNPELDRRSTQRKLKRLKEARRSSDPEQRAWAMFRARRNRGTPGLTKEWFEERLRAGVCEVTGIPFVLDQMRHQFSPEVDRKVPGGPYAPENCQLVIRAYNMAKGAGSHEHVLSMAHALVHGGIGIPVGDPFGGRV